MVKCRQIYQSHGSYGVDAGKCIDVVLISDTIKIRYDEEDGGAFLDPTLHSRTKLQLAS